MTKDQSTLFDHPEGYGAVSRALHWLMVALFAWQFLSAVLHAIDHEMSVARFFWSWHFSVGFLLFLFSFGPLSNIPLAHGTIFGERLTYFPSVGLALAAGLGVGDFGGKGDQSVQRHAPTSWLM